MATITLEGIGKVYAGGNRAVSDVNIDIADGEFLVLVGPSGCGKSTLLRMIAGLETITEGTAKIGDRIVNRVEPADRDIAMVFQNYALYPHMSVRQNLEYGLKNRKTPKDEIARRVASAARILEIEPFLDRKPRALSGGQRQRVAMGRAIVRDPAVFLFDEPLSNLDAKLRGQMRVEIKRLQKRLGTTSVYVTHDQLEAMTLADRLVVLKGGHIEQIGSPLDVYERPASTFVASFIGSPAMNLIPVATRSGRLVMDKGSWLDAPALDGAENLILGIRPEHLEIVIERPSNGNGLTMELLVNVVEPVGAESFVYGTVGEHGPEIIVRAPSHARYESGARVFVTAKADDLHHFDTESSRRIETRQKIAA